MRKKRILFCSEATFLNTGYATYTREILNYLYSTQKYELAELASYAEPNDKRAKNIPWAFFGASLPKDASQELVREYSSVPSNQFGEYAFERVCLSFFPDIVCDIRDFWMLDFAERSPFRKYFKWCIMPTVDAAPQARQWIYTYKNADACLTYSDWAGEVLKSQGGGFINYIGSAPPSAHHAYKPHNDKNGIKEYFNIDPNTKIVGTVMRNQRRKLYPDLFEMFRIFLDNVTDDNNYLLYCHTSYPDMGWDIPELLQQYNLSSKVIFTYVCGDTLKPFPSFFRGPVTESPYTGKFNATLSNVRTGLSYEDLSSIINMFDIYVQYANCEGFGLPQVEAAACGVPVMSTDYSAMESVIRQLGGIPVKPKALYKEMETGCMRAVPDNKLAATLLQEFFSLSDEDRKKMGDAHRENFLKHFQWNKSGSVWESYFDSVEVSDSYNHWFNSSPNIQQSAPKISNWQSVPPDKLAEWLIVEVLRDPSKLNSYMHLRLTKDLIYGCSTGVTGGMYFNEDASMFEQRPVQSFSFDIAYEHFCRLCEKNNFWEQERLKTIRKLGQNK
jgi:glycosyltransferase involved in cell wall biosynthesis